MHASGKHARDAVAPDGDWASAGRDIQWSTAARRSGQWAIRAVLVLLCVLGPYAMVGGLYWPVVALPAAAILCLLEYRIRRVSDKVPGDPVERPRRGATGSAAPPAPATDANNESPAQDAGARGPPIPDFWALAAAQGVEGMNVFFSREGDDKGRALAQYLPTRGRPTFYLTRTLVNLLSPRQLLAVFAHELAHYRLRHSRKTILAWFGVELAAVAAACLILQAAWPATASLRQAAQAAPMVLLTWCAARAFLSLARKACNRHQERRAHRLALEMTRDPRAFVSALSKIAAHNGYAEPPQWKKWLFHDVPSLGDSVAIARRYAQEHDLPLE